MTRTQRDRRTDITELSCHNESRPREIHALALANGWELWDIEFMTWVEYRRGTHKVTLNYSCRGAIIQTDVSSRTLARSHRKGTVAAAVAALSL